MVKQVLYAILGLGALAAAGPALVWHPLADLSVGRNGGVLGQTRATALAERKQQGQGFAAWHQVWPTSAGMRQ